MVWSKKWATICYSGMTATGTSSSPARTRVLRAYNARNGNLLQVAALKGGVNAPVVTYKVNDKQYVAVFAGGNIASIFGGSTDSHAGIPS